MFRRILGFRQIYGTLIAYGLAIAVCNHFAQAQVSIGAPSSSSIAACDDYFTKVLGNPADMRHSSGQLADVNNYFKAADVNGFSSVALGNGSFTGTTSAEGANLYLWSPVACGSYPVGGRFGAKASSGFEEAAIIFNSQTAQKYRYFSMKMKHPSVSTTLGPGYRLIWDRDCDYAKTRTGTAAQAVYEGWQVYSQDLGTATLGGTPKLWTDGDITGFAIQPTQQAPSEVSIAWVRLEDPTTCSNLGVTIPVQAAASGSDDLITYVVDDNTDPFDGIIKPLASVAAPGNGSLTFSSALGMPPGNYNVVGLLDSDFATLERIDPYDFSQTTDILVTGDVSGATFVNGTLSGSTSSTGANIYINIPTTGLNANRYKKLSIKLSRSSSSQPIRLLWDSGFEDIRESSRVVGTDVYQVDLANHPNWKGTITTLIVRPSLQAGVSFALDFLSLRSSGFDTERSTSTARRFTSSAPLKINAAPSLTLQEPDIRGGESIRPWNMRNGDLVLFQNLRTDADLSYPGEKYLNFLPDVRTVAGLRGDFFKGANISGNDDPTNYSSFPLYNDNPVSWSSADYRMACFKLFVDHEFDLGLGSVARVLWRTAETGQFYTSEDIALITDRWTGSPWYEYCLDLAKIQTDSTSLTDRFAYKGTIDAFRIDPHEFSYSKLTSGGAVDKTSPPISAPYYFDYIKVSKPNTSNGKFAIVYESADDDGTTPTVTFFYSTVRQASGGTPISSSKLSCENRVCVWDTSGIPDGDYYLYAEAKDALTTSTAIAGGFVRIRNGGSLGEAPILDIEAPLSSSIACNTLQVKGYALQPDRNEPVAAVQVFANNTLLGLIRPSEYSPRAVAAHPTLDSSNSGFNVSYDISSLGNSALPISVVAYSSQGVKTTHGPFTLQRGNCPALLSDPNPAGVPEDPRAGILPTPTPPTPDSGSAPSIRIASHSKKGVLQLNIAGVGKSTNKCKIELFAGASEGAVTTSLGRYSIKAVQEKKNLLRLSAGNIQIDAKKLATVYFKATRSCTAESGISSEVKSMKPKTTKGSIKSIGQLRAAVKKAVSVSER